MTKLELFEKNGQKYSESSINDLIEALNQKINDLILSQQNLEKKIIQFDKRFKPIETYLEKLVNSTSEFHNNSNIIQIQQNEPEFIKASDLLQLKVKNDSEKSKIQSKIDICVRLLDILEKKFELKSITRKEYRDNKNKINLKIKSLEEKINELNK